MPNGSFVVESKHLVAAVAAATLLIAEAWAPAFAAQRRRWRRLLRHDLRNVLFGGFNALAPGAAFATALVAIDGAAAEHNFGLLRQVAWPEPVECFAALLLFDLWMYWWHRLNHAVPFLWRFHRMHHSDPAMDTSSGVRFHPGEILMSGAARLAVLPLLGISSIQLVLYETILLPVVLFHHANVRLPRWLDFGLFRAGLLVTPAMHRVHHSQVRSETNSNYSSMLPLWDRLFGSLRVRQDVDQIEFGLEEFASKQSQTLAGMIRTPLAAHKKTGDDTVAG